MRRIPKAYLVERGPLTMTFVGVDPRVTIAAVDRYTGRRSTSRLVWAGPPCRLPNVVQPRNGNRDAAEAGYRKPSQGRSENVSTRPDARQGVLPV